MEVPKESIGSSWGAFVEWRVYADANEHLYSILSAKGSWPAPKVSVVVGNYHADFDKERLLQRKHVELFIRIPTLPALKMPRPQLEAVPRVGLYCDSHNGLDRRNKIASTYRRTVEWNCRGRDLVCYLGELQMRSTANLGAKCQFPLHSAGM